MSSFSSSTSRLIVPPSSSSSRRNFEGTGDNLAEMGEGGRRRLTNSVSSFSIIDEHNKEPFSTVDDPEFDADDSPGSEGDLQNFSSSSPGPSLLSIIRSTGGDLRHAAVAAAAGGTTPLALQQAMATSGSRFRIVPVESRYTRGRWNCFDYYDKDFKLVPNGLPRHTELPHCNGNASDANASSGKALIPALDSPRIAPISLIVPSSLINKDRITNNNSIDRFANALQPPIPPPFSGRVTPTPSEMIQNFGLERSLSVASYGGDRSALLDLLPNVSPIGSPRPDAYQNNEVDVIPKKCPLDATARLCMAQQRSAAFSLVNLCEKLRCSHLPKSILLATSSKYKEPHWNHCANILRGSGGQGPGTSSAMVAIDSKIEQAMDLVKTHLMFAVREEVEVLRARIIDLETTVHQLETENAILRNHVPNDIVNKLALSGTKSTSPATLTAN